MTNPTTFPQVQVVDAQGNIIAGGGIGASDASAANQVSQIVQETAINTVLGVKTDAKATNTDGTSISAISIWKQISASIQALVTAFGAALTRGLGATDGNTQRVALASDGGAVEQSGTWTVQPGNTANTTAWKVDNSGVTQPISNALLTNLGVGEYETVAASQTAQALGATGAAGDYISEVLVIPATTSPGLVTLLDGAISIPLFVGGASSVSNLIPFSIPLGMISVSGAWKLTTGANVSAIGIGNFT